ncbi:MAG: N-6 DNA methylase [Candidatus Sericytochromatia bacterium]
MLNASMKSKIDSLWNSFWSGGIANPLTAIEQISYLLFMKRLDVEDQRAIANAEWSGVEYQSIFAGNDNCRWRHFSVWEGGQMLDHVRAMVFPFTQSVGGKNDPFARHMLDAVFILPKASLLVEAVAVINELWDEVEKERAAGQAFQDTLGDLYEFLLSEIASAGKNGQFRTPRHVIQMITALVDPKLGETVCDPACGTGGFLVGAYQHILTANTTPQYRQADEHGIARGTRGDMIVSEGEWKQLREQTLFGYDFDTSMVRIGLMNLMLHGITRPKIDYKDTLSKQFNEDNRYSVVLANPPFKGSIDKGDVNESLKVATTKTELLFVNRIINMLKMGGRAGVIVPDGVLFSSSKAHQDLRNMLVESCELQGVVSMPSGVFRPYAGVSTAVLVFVKGGQTENVWFYDMQADGFSLDDKRETISANDIPDVLARWADRDPARDSDRAGKAFFVSVDAIRANKYDLSINRYKEVFHEIVVYEPPNVILARLRALESEIAQDLDELEVLLG